jgi:hypothetical protein
MSESQRILQTIIFVFLVMVCGFIAGCTSSSGSSVSQQSPVSPTDSFLVEKVEVYHFHGNNQCSSCVAVGDLAEKTVNANFKEELASGRLVFAHVNYDLPDNAALAAKYGVTGSSLWLGIYDTNGFHRQQNMDVWYLTGDKEKYKTYLAGVISKRLNGDLS